ncbi:uncharacterized protein ACMZJ9_019867 [Mantella aurantiaca]
MERPWQRHLCRKRFQKLTRKVLLLLLISDVIFRACATDLKKDSRIDLILCASTDEYDLCEFLCGADFVLEVDRKGTNIAQEQRDRSSISKFDGCECATIRDLRERDAGVYNLYVTRKDGKTDLKITLPLTEHVLRDLRNGNNFNMSTSRGFKDLPVPVSWRNASNDRHETLQQAARNGTIPDGCSIALLVTSPDPATETSPTLTTPTGMLDPPGNIEIGIGEGIAIAIAVTVVIGVGITIFIIIKNNCT